MARAGTPREISDELAAIGQRNPGDGAGSVDREFHLPLGPLCGLRGPPSTVCGDPFAVCMPPVIPAAGLRSPHEGILAAGPAWDEKQGGPALGAAPRASAARSSAEPDAPGTAGQAAETAPAQRGVGDEGAPTTSPSRRTSVSARRPCGSNASSRSSGAT